MNRRYLFGRVECKDGQVENEAELDRKICQPAGLVIEGF
jgi:hypothetical protein